MATASVPNDFVHLAASSADAVDANFAALVAFLNASVVHRDGTQAFTAVVSGVTPTSAAHLATKGYVDSVVPGGAAPGDIIMSGAATRAGFLLCDGSAVSRTTYANLFAAIGIAYGAGDGSTTFNLPDLRGRSPMGAGSAPGLTTRTRGGYVGVEEIGSGVPHTTATYFPEQPGAGPYAAVQETHKHNTVVVHPSAVVNFFIKT